MVRLRHETLQHVTPGTVVSMKMDPRDVKRARGLLGIVCDRSGNRAGGVQVATEEGIVTADLKKREYFIPSDRYAVQKVQDLALPDKLEVVREEIMNGLFDLGKQKQKVSMKTAYRLVEGGPPIERKGCGCKGKKCTHFCGCVKAKKKCSLQCSSHEQKNSGSLDQHEAMSVNSARLQYQHYSRKRYEFISPCCSHNHFFVVKVIFDIQDPSIFSEVCVYDSLHRTGRRTDAVNRHAPPAQYLCQLQLFLAQFCFVGLPQSEVLAKNPKYILRNAVYAQCPVQENGHDCALFAYASVLHIVHGHALSAVTLTQQNITQLRDGLNTVLTCNTPDVNTPDPKKFLSSTFLRSFFPCLSEKENDNVFLKLLYKKSENTSPEGKQSKLNPAEGKQADEVLTEVDSAYRPVLDDPRTCYVRE
ncbi:hypothetical protein IV203_012661 [Nitzschia inconspicua]|uniref:Uncharacterized protein n=1 Tax=Nitzschia inconspicua TaxID=303405 RepID=A0A9K3KVE8_9STRA|nr:hypothetical protein IV203_012661 [Nitzschia inconspicua]